MPLTQPVSDPFPQTGREKLRQKCPGKRWCGAGRLKTDPRLHRAPETARATRGTGKGGIFVVIRPPAHTNCWSAVTRTRSLLTRSRRRESCTSKRRGTSVYEQHISARTQPHRTYHRLHSGPQRLLCSTRALGSRTGGSAFHTQGWRCWNLAKQGPFPSVPPSGPVSHHGHVASDAAG